MRGILLVLIILLIPLSAESADCWLSVHGKGMKDGTSREHAMSALDRTENAQLCWNKTSPSGTMHVLEGEYDIAENAYWALVIDSSNDGSKNFGGFKKLLGEGTVVLKGSRPIPYHSSRKEKGGTWIRIRYGARDVWIQHFTVHRVAHGISAKEGRNKKLRLRNLLFQDTRQNILLSGHSDCRSISDCPVRQDDLSQDIIIESTKGFRYSKRHIRLSRGIHHVKVIDSHADADFLDDDFAVGFDVENPSHDIEFLRCSSRRNRFSRSDYWNGDGFKAENETFHIRWNHCSAFENADAGFDIKTRSARMTDIVAERNNRNIRTWSKEKAVLRNINASYSEHQGGTGSEAGIWTMGILECYRCTLHNNGIGAAAENNAGSGKITFFDSVLSLDAGREGRMTREEKGTEIHFIRTLVSDGNAITK